MISSLAQGFERHHRDDRSVVFIDGADKLNEIPFRQLRDRALGLLTHLNQRGIGRGDELVISTNNNLAFLDAFWACQYGGIVPVPIAPGTSAEQRNKLFRVFRLLKRPFVYTDHQTGARIRALSDQIGNAAEYDELKRRTVLTENITDLSTPAKAVDVGLEDIAFIQFSSGSTSDPKGIVLSQLNLITNIGDIRSATALSDNDVALSWMPLTHDMGLIGFHLAMLLSGATHYIMATDTFVRRPLLWLSSAADLRASLLCSPNFGYRLFLKAFDRWPIRNLDLSAIRLIFNGAEPVSTSVCRQFMDTLAPFGLKSTSMMPVYGLAEATVAVSFPAPGQHFESIRLDRKHVGIDDKILESNGEGTMEIAAVGQIIDNCELRIVDSKGVLAVEKQVGHIQIRGDNVTQGYYAHPEYDRSAYTEDGWLDTGDLGFTRADNLYVSGRLKDLIFVNGQNLYAHDLESIVCQLQGFEPGKVVVSSVPADDQEERIVVFVLHFGEIDEFLVVDAAVRRIIAEQAGVEVSLVVPVERIPKTTSGKVQRFVLRQEFNNGDFNVVLSHLTKLRATNLDVASDCSTMEQRLMQICASSLKGVQLQRNDNFFEIGMNSLKLIEVHELLDQHFPGQLEISDIFDHPTLAQLAAFLDQSDANNS